MIHRIRLNRKLLLGDNYDVISANTTTWVSGVTLDQQWTNSNTFPTQGSPNNYKQPITPKSVTNTSTLDQNEFNKSIVIPLEIKFEPTDYSDLINDWVNSETQRVINKILDGEKIKYSSGEVDGITINFRFSDRDNGGNYSDDYKSNGFDLPDEYKLNRFKKSYFRLYFYDGESTERSNLLFVEDLPVEQGVGYGPSVSKASFKLRNLYWDREDPLMDNTYDDRVIYMNAKFFNSKTGQIQTFYNLPTTEASPIGITKYNDRNNIGWRFSPIKIINPNTMGVDNNRFMIVNGVGANTSDTITLSEFILK